MKFSILNLQLFYMKINNSVTYETTPPRIKIIKKIIM